MLVGPSGEVSLIWRSTAIGVADVDGHLDMIDLEIAGHRQHSADDALIGYGCVDGCRDGCCAVACIGTAPKSTLGSAISAIGEM